MAQLVAHHTGSVGVTGSSPVSSTEWKPPVHVLNPGVLFLGLMDKSVFARNIAGLSTRKGGDPIVFVKSTGRWEGD